MTRINLTFGFVAHSNSNVGVSFGIHLMIVSTLVITFKIQTTIQNNYRGSPV